MLWRVRATLPNRPGALAGLAAECGKSAVNILGFQMFPGSDLVTDELVLDSPQDWTAAEIGTLIERSGGQTVSVVSCTEAALADQPTRYVQAAAAVLAAPASFPDVLAHLFDAEAESDDEDLDTLEVTVSDVLVQVRRAAPFTATERARAEAMALLLDDVLARGQTTWSAPPVGAAAPEFVSDGDEVRAVVQDAAVGIATIHPSRDDPDAFTLTLEVDPAWRRQGIGSRLLADAGRLAASRGGAELVLTTQADNQHVLPMVLAAGLRGRIRMSGDKLTVRIPLGALQR